MNPIMIASHYPDDLPLDIVVGATSQRAEHTVADLRALLRGREENRKLEADYQRVNVEWQKAMHDAACLRIERDETRAASQRLTEERDRLLALLNTPETEDFDKAIPLEAAHQQERWGKEHDETKDPEQWYWVVGYLAGKALASQKLGDFAKAKHHCVSTAAVLRNWHAHLRTRTALADQVPMGAGAPPEGEK